MSLINGSRDATSGLVRCIASQPGAPQSPRMNKRVSIPKGSGGFTLIELLIAIIVIGVLAAVAFPSFLDSVKKGRRSEAYSAISAVQNAQERWRGNNALYATTMTALSMPASTPGGYYQVTIASADAVSYEIKADGSTSSQASDGQCAKLAVRMQNGAITYSGCATCSSFTFAASHPCWAQ
jgi:type IV pilus assembly protein PilE